MLDGDGENHLDCVSLKSQDISLPNITSKKCVCPLIYDILRDRELFNNLAIIWIDVTYLATSFSLPTLIFGGWRSFTFVLLVTFYPISLAIR